VVSRGPRIQIEWGKITEVGQIGCGMCVEDGTYQVKLKVKDVVGTESVEYTQNIVISNYEVSLFFYGILDSNKQYITGQTIEEGNEPVYFYSEVYDRGILDTIQYEWVFPDGVHDADTIVTRGLTDPYTGSKSEYYEYIYSQSSHIYDYSISGSGILYYDFKVKDDDQSSWTLAENLEFGISDDPPESTASFFSGHVDTSEYMTCIGEATHTLSVSFYGSQTNGNPMDQTGNSFEWDFGDGGSSYIQNPSHSFSVETEMWYGFEIDKDQTFYYITLDVEDNDGLIISTSDTLMLCIEKDTNGDGEIDLLDDDDDGDGISDIYERDCGTNKKDSTDTPSDFDGDGIPDSQEDSDGDGSYDNVELAFSSDTIDDPSVSQRLLIIYHDSAKTNVKQLIYPFTESSYSGPEPYYEIESAGSNEPTWSTLSRELAPIMIFEQGTQEFPTSIFFDGDRDMSNNGVPSKYPDGSITQDGSETLDHLFSLSHECRNYLTEGAVPDEIEDEFANNGYTLSTGSQLNKESDHAWNIEDKPGDPSPTIYPIKWTRNGMDIYTYNSGDGIRDDVQRLGFTNWGDGYFKDDINNDDDPTDGFTDWERKNELPTVYTKAIKGTDPDTGHEILGIQYWFYYVFHDDPGGGVHPHDWWYFWIVYDMESYEPTRTYYDFHHALREKDWDVIYKDGFHPKIWMDASGHRILWSGSYATYGLSWSDANPLSVEGLYDIVGSVVPIPFSLVDVDVTLSLDLTISQDPMFDGMLFWESGGEIKPDLAFTIEWELEILGQGIWSGTFSYDLEPALDILGWGLSLLIQYLVEEINDIDERAPDYSMPFWWGDIRDWRSNMDTFVEGETLNVEDFNHWVYVYDWGLNLEDDPDVYLKDQERDACQVGYFGDNIYSGDHANMWPYHDLNFQTVELQWMETLQSVETGEHNEFITDNGWEAWEWKETYEPFTGDPYCEGPRPWRQSQFWEIHY